MCGALEAGQWECRNGELMWEGGGGREVSGAENRKEKKLFVNRGVHRSLL